MISVPDAALAALAATGAWGNHGEDLGDCSSVVGTLRLR
jgi:hypothetical protein